MICYFCIINTHLKLAYCWNTIEMQIWGYIFIFYAFIYLKHNLSYTACKSNQHGTSLGVQWLSLHALNAEGRGSTPDWETKILHATRALCSQKKKKECWGLGEGLGLEMITHMGTQSMIHTTLKTLEMRKVRLWDSKWPIQGYKSSNALVMNWTHRISCSRLFTSIWLLI